MGQTINKCRDAQQRASLHLFYAVAYTKTQLCLCRNTKFNNFRISQHPIWCAYNKPNDMKVIPHLYI
ncbi:hypothetical protein EJ73_00015 [Hoylesella shahii DSM 15611 = JCM 12083]|uniref:Uncharacterized protein n=1 Tax=Hoylesella shahii DSM 15611 = JCM 12083 TaxID=1122991 RepID=A0A318I646_9BACT|nr:hypothetical protein EJ73_00015 [Hoylesella shahii DSM 15611 = JCM 12083]